MDPAAGEADGVTACGDRGDSGEKMDLSKAVGVAEDTSELARRRTPSPSSAGSGGMCRSRHVMSPETTVSTRKNATSAQLYDRSAADHADEYSGGVDGSTN
jgi:hypothetical protein